MRLGGEDDNVIGRGGCSSDGDSWKWSFEGKKGNGSWNIPDLLPHPIPHPIPHLIPSVFCCVCLENAPNVFKKEICSVWR